MLKTAKRVSSNIAGFISKPWVFFQRGNFHGCKGEDGEVG